MRVRTGLKNLGQNVRRLGTRDGWCAPKTARDGRASAKMREESQERTKDKRGFTFVSGGVFEGVPFWSGGEEWEEKRRRDVLVSVRRYVAGSAP